MNHENLIKLAAILEAQRIPPDADDRYVLHCQCRSCRLARSNELAMAVQLELERRTTMRLNARNNRAPYGKQRRKW